MNNVLDLIHLNIVKLLITDIQINQNDTFIYLELCNDTTDCMDGEVCIFSENPNTGECIDTDIGKSANSTGKNIIKHRCNPGI